jgi:hypothetical protein
VGCGSTIRRFKSGHSPLFIYIISLLKNQQ